jgi:Na+-transporting NADH:ubiquinone oxidoreductase subunit A
LLRALVVGDAESARALGALELEEEDLALCSFLCPSGIDYGALLRRMLERLEADQ